MPPWRDLSLQEEGAEHLELMKTAGSISLTPVYRVGRREGALSRTIQLGDLVGSRDPMALGAPSMWKPHVITGSWCCLGK